MARPTLAVGEVYGRWRVLAARGVDRGGNRRWLVRCGDCGAEVLTTTQYLRPVRARRGCERCREWADD